MTDSASAATCKELSWSYDTWGNRLTQTPTSGTCNSWSASYNASNQPTTSGYQFDAAGNMTHDASHSYTYDAENRITQVDGGSTASYVYDAMGRRVRKISGVVTTDYFYDLLGNVVAEIQGTVLSAAYVYLNGRLLSEYANGTTYFIH